jgi:hypothetical protein
VLPGRRSARSPGASGLRYGLRAGGRLRSGAPA